MEFISLPPIDVDVTNIDEDNVLLAGEFSSSEGEWALDDFNWLKLLLELLLLLLFNIWFVFSLVDEEEEDDEADADAEVDDEFCIDLVLLLWLWFEKEEEELDRLVEDRITFIDGVVVVVVVGAVVACGCLKLTAWNNFWAVLVVSSKSSFLDKIPLNTGPFDWTIDDDDDEDADELPLAKGLTILYVNEDVVEDSGDDEDEDEEDEEEDDDEGKEEVVVWCCS